MRRKVVEYIKGDGPVIVNVQLTISKLIAEFWMVAELLLLLSELLLLLLSILLLLLS